MNNNKNSFKSQAANGVYSYASRMAKIQKAIAAHMNLPYSFTNKSVIINSISGNSASIIINSNYSNIQQFNLNLINL